ncbi:MAG: FAD-dependent thymidylate synthase [Acidobacteria bacterium]|nr:FAD-dependent thymidylate synthase [Acidobacteriota bacterium]
MADSKNPLTPRHGPRGESVEVFAVFGAEPEIQAYAMAKYSRSALSMKDSLREINQQKAEKFLNTFYFQYGHRSIADLAHLALAIEKLSILAAIVIVDEQRWDGQERSTRYQDFRKSGYYVPDFGDDGESHSLYRETVESLFAEYESASQAMFGYLAEITPRPVEMKQEAYDRTLRARAFDITRYLLPLATNTSLGQIVNARTLESQVARLFSHTHKEVRVLAERLKCAASQPAYNVNIEFFHALLHEIRQRDPELAERAAQELLKPVRVAPTLVKYADPNRYQIEARRDLRQAAAELMKHSAIRPAGAVDLIDDHSLELELATTLLYQHGHHSYRQIQEVLESVGAKMQQEIIDLGLRHRGPHDELLRAFSGGQQFRFDILMDIGGFRDLHRHRRCTQIGQDFTVAHGYEVPEEYEAASLSAAYRVIMQKTADRVERLRASSAPEAVENSEYAIPLAYRKRTLFKMDFAEVLYIAELRTTPAGHRSYRNVAYAMYQAVVKKHPGLAQYFRVHDVREPVDLLKR